MKLKEFLEELKDNLENEEWSEIDEAIREIYDFTKQYFNDVQVKDEYGDIVIAIGDIEKTIKIPMEGS